MLLVSPGLFNKTQNLFMTSYLVLGSASFCLLTLLWTSGGINAPGVFWLSAIPLSTAILLGIGPALLSIFVVGFFLIASVITQYFEIDTNLMEGIMDPNQERSINVFFFLFYSIFTSIYFIRSESKFQEQIHDQKNEINRLLRILVHDIATPLTTIIFTAELLKKGKSRDPDKSYQSILKSTKNIKILLDRVKSLSALKDGKTVIERKPIHLKNVIEELSNDLKVQMEQKQIKFTYHLNHTDTFIIGDQSVLSQVILTNIMTNAIKFSESEGCINLHTQQLKNKILIEIRDYGIGIPDTIKQNLFSSTEQTHRKGTSGESGTGFGMPLVKDFTHKMGGTIEVHSSEIDTPEFKRGTCFKLQFASTSQINQNPPSKKFVS